MNAARAAATKAMLPMTPAVGRGSAAFAEMGHGQHRNAEARRHLADGVQHRSEFGIAMTVDLAEVGTHRIDNDKANIPDTLDLLFEELEIPLQVEASPTLAILISNR
jgi:hypothetical protein